MQPYLLLADRFALGRHCRMFGGVAFYADQVQVTLFTKSKQRDEVNTFLRGHGYEVDSRTLWQRWFGKKAS